MQYTLRTADSTPSPQPNSAIPTPAFSDSPSYQLEAQVGDVTDENAQSPSITLPPTAILTLSSAASIIAMGAVRVAKAMSEATGTF